MEQLSGKTVQKLLSGAQRGLFPEQAGGRRPARRHGERPGGERPGGERPGVDLDGRDWIDPVADSGARTGNRRGAAEQAIRNAAEAALHQSVERRVVRRAEAMWRRLAGDAQLPAAHRAGELLHMAVRGKALLLQAQADSPPQLVFVGEHLMSLTGLVAGGLPDAQARSTALGDSLVELAERAVQTAAPGWLESGGEDGPAVSSGRTDNSRAENRDSNLQLLMRAVALPFAATGSTATAGSAVVVASWRRLLSREETRALHRELRAAMDWIQTQAGR